MQMREPWNDWRKDSWIHSVVIMRNIYEMTPNAMLKGRNVTSVRKLEILKDSVGVLGRYGKIRQIAEQPDQSDEDRT